MSHIKKRPNGTYQAQVQHQQHRASKVFITKGEAKYWSDNTLKEFKKLVQYKVDDRMNFSGVLTRYMDEVSTTKRGYKWEATRIKMFIDHPIFKGMKFSKVNASVISQYRDERLKTVLGSTVNRELNLLSAIFTRAIKEWQIINENPVLAIMRPKNPAHRDRLISDVEIGEFLDAIPYNPKDKAVTISERVGVALLFALETAMRAGEICSLKRKNIIGQVAKLEMTKNGKPRDVPLSKEAVRLLGLLPKDNELVFNLRSSQIDSLFRKYKSGIKGADYTFHDTRHTCITKKLAPKLDVLSLAKAIGHSDPKTLMIYFNPKASDLAKLLD